MKLDILAFGAHPDDVELGCGGTLSKMAGQGTSIGIIDLTRGELGTRGNAETRMQEAANAAQIMGVQVRENLYMRDGFFKNNEENKLQIIKKNKRVPTRYCHLQCSHRQAHRPRTRL